MDGGVLSPDIITDQRANMRQLYGLLDKDKKERPKENRPAYVIMDQDYDGEEEDEEYGGMMGGLF